jgi:uncharacterized protein YunC (DUF1805 family)
MIETAMIETQRGAALGIKVNLHKRPLLIIRGEKGYLASGINHHEAEIYGESAVIFKNCRSFSQMLGMKVDYVSKEARKLKININMTGRQALEKLV